MKPLIKHTPERPVNLAEFDFANIGEADQPVTCDADEDQLFRRMFSSELQRPMPRRHRLSPAARFSIGNTPFGG